MNTARGLYGAQMAMPKLSVEEIRAVLLPALEFYSQQDRGIISERAETCIPTRQKNL